MRWRDGRESDNVEDRLGIPISRGAKIGGLGGLGLVAVVLIGMFFGIDPIALLQGISGTHDPLCFNSANRLSGVETMKCANSLPLCWATRKSVE